MKKNAIKNLMREFIDANSNPIKKGLPSVKNNSSIVIQPTKKVPLIPVNKWIETDKKSLKKIFHFKDSVKRNEFLFRIFEHEIKTKHHGDITISENEVEIVLLTKNIGMVTELDKEYAEYADSVYKDILVEWKKNERFQFIPC